MYVCMNACINVYGLPVCINLCINVWYKRMYKCMYTSIRINVCINVRIRLTISAYIGYRPTQHSLLVIPASLTSPTTQQFHWLPSPPALNSKFFSLLSPTPKILCDHIRPLSLLPLSALPNAMIILCLVLGQPAPLRRGAI